MILLPLFGCWHNATKVEEIESTKFQSSKVEPEFPHLNWFMVVTLRGVQNMGVQSMATNLRDLFTITKVQDI
jgi:hypothetical protein